MLLPLPDRGPVPNSVDVRTLLCEQSAVLHGAELRLRTAGLDLAPPGTDGWRGSAEKAQAAVVAQLGSVVESILSMLEESRQLTDAAIWGMGDVG